MPASNTISKAPETVQSQSTLNEPSMEDILASIRRIIAEDQSNSLARSGLGGITRRPAPPVQAPASDAVDADTHIVALAAEVPAPVRQAPEAEELLPEDATLDVQPEQDTAAGHTGDDLRGSYDASEEAPEITHDVEAEAHHDDVFLHEDHEIEDAHDAHAHELTISDDRSGFEDREPLISPAAGASITSSFQTLADTMLMQDPELIERIMRETLRPMLKTWLDDHLPTIVERLVRAEIERVARGGRSRD